ncbi:Bug family tripartite tricarboxylate transporter substrate binding protein [Paracraurococcus lichenis]|uniref:Tripartite tricarboxylate transporter substrate binding protein n=1 Tax=Paracraurococcus lichenis TaxID=3064888 RepID=A0ABT9EB26_9PROT|nr:tripartite tricarboxylate transporter substrate binding protein [Paracraurococcus sp. LOR1-02]MDO9713337.1 tripartite tricarboxylate transporter substrate binding protein [Paracraurococcus sp. LOR1-02]
MPTRRALLLAPLLAPVAARAEAPFPDRPIRLVIPFTPGGTNDIVGRLVTEGMARRLGQPFVIENRGGAGGMLGAEVVAKAAPDGYTILLGGSGSLTITSLVHARVPYDVATGFAPIGLMGQGPNVIVVQPSLPVTSLRELQALARRADPPLAYASPGVGSTGHAAGAMIAQALDVEMTHIPYRGTGPALNDMLAGRVQVFTNALAPMQPHIQSGALRAIAIAGRARSAAMPDLPTTGEQGFPQIEAATWFGLLATGGTPPERVAILHRALNATLAEPEVRRRLLEGGVEVEPSGSPEAFARFFAEDRARWAPVVRRAEMRVE